LYTAAQVRELDRRAIAGGISGFDLMCRAASSALAMLRQRWPAARRIAVFCGTGNNGGDGSVMAALALEAGFEVQVWWVGDEARVHGDAARAMAMARQAGVSIHRFEESIGALSDVSSGSVMGAPHPAFAADVIVDALLGIGLEGAPRALYRHAVRVINASGVPVLALDIPSGLCADTGRIFSEAVHADVTVTFIAAKQGLYTGQGPAVCGDVLLEELAVPRQVIDTLLPACHRVTASRVRDCLPRRRRDSHKGRFGHVLVVGGNHGMGGAMLMAVEAAGRSGAGLISAASRPDHLAALLVRRPEAMFHAIHAPADLQKALASASVIVCGPGLGRDDWARAVFSACLAADLPLVLDADALNLLAAEGSLLTLGRAAPVVITPHPGEAARLLGVDTARLQHDRFDAIRRLQVATGATVVLKGAGTLIATGAEVWLAAVGNPGMASGGMGDVLAGIIGGLLAQGLSAEDAATCGVWLHGTAADHAAQDGERGLLATDLFLPLRRLVNGLSRESGNAA
jgi:NAD(P)H-hydrate epimerase